jgi:WD repeat-containing protein mio
MISAAATLAGCFGNRNNSNLEMVQQCCKNLSFQISDDYLGVLFKIIGEGGNWNSVLKSSPLPISDLMAIALRFVNDQELKQYYDSRLEKVIRHGRIDGFLLTGWSPDGIDLLQQYLDLFGDVQSAALIASIRPNSTDCRIRNWIASYSDLLDQWGLFHLRASFDIHRKRFSNDHIKIKQLNIRCTYCNHSISPGHNSSEAVQTFGIGEKSKPFCCPNCIKPLPRCSLCLLTMGNSVDAEDISQTPEDIGITY